jgi:hypothetical protein
LSKLGDAYINFVYSLAKSKKKKEPSNERVSSEILSNALKRAGLRKYLPSRFSRHEQGDAVEALLIYTWLKEIIPIEECVNILTEKADSPIDAFTDLINLAKKRLEEYSIGKG